MKKENWRIDFTWIKACAGHSGNELADKLTKEAIKNSEICYNKIPKSEVERQEAEKTTAKWDNGTTLQKGGQPRSISRTSRND